MKLKYDFEQVEMGDDEIIAVPVGVGAGELQGVLKLNYAGKVIFDLLKSDALVEDIVEQLLVRYDNDKSTIAEYVNSVIEVLMKYGLIA